MEINIISFEIKNNTRCNLIFIKNQCINVGEYELIFNFLVISLIKICYNSKITYHNRQNGYYT
ncbi:hypothetical protein DZC18_000265 [Clostridium beijerinckii]|nr:hypothetical protein [Clostridium beijerinckii]